MYAVSSVSRALARGFLVGCVFIGLGTSALAQVQRVSVSSAGGQANDYTSEASMSSDGRYVLFVSSATSLTPEGRSGTFLRDRQTNQTTWIGDTPPGSGLRPSISADGTRIVFYQTSAGWVVRNRTDGRQTAIDPIGGESGQSNDIVAPMISANGQFVAFYSDRRSDGSHRGAYVRNLETGALCVAHQSTAGEPGDGVLVGSPSITGDGRRVSLVSTARNLVATDFNLSADAFVHDCGTGVTSGAWISLLPRGSLVDHLDWGEAFEAVLSGDGRRLAVAKSSAFGHPQVPHSVEIFDVTMGASTGAFLEWRPPPLIAAGMKHLRLSQDGRFLAGVQFGVSTLGRQEIVTRYDIGTRVAAPLPLPSHNSPVVYDVGLTGDGEEVLFVSAGSTLVPDDTNDRTDAFVYARDGDGDGMSSLWELAFGLDPSSAADGARDDDGDGATNAQEFAAGTHPSGVPASTRLFAEGASTALFGTRFAIVNPNPTTEAKVQLRYNPAGRAPQTVVFRARAGHTSIVEAGWLPSMSGAEFSTTVESDLPVVVDRRMTWAEGSHAETGLSQPSNTWHFAEGATTGEFELFYLLHNGGSSPSTVRIRFLTPAGAPVERFYTVPVSSRFTIWVGLISQLASSEVAAEIQVTAGPPIVAERAQYLGRPGRPFAAGHESAGVTTPSTAWFFAEGATGPYFDLFVLLSNPGADAAQVEATYLLPDGSSRQQMYTVPGATRFNLWVDELMFAGVKALANTAVSVSLRSTNGVPFVAERSMWWPGGAGSWEEAHNSPGATTSGIEWAIADGEIGGSAQHETYLLIANPSSVPATIDVTLLYEDRESAVRSYTIAPTSRFNVAVRTEFPAVTDARFGAIVKSTGNSPVPIVVERAIYATANGVPWGAGAAALAARLQ